MRQCRRDFATHRRNRLERESVPGGVGSTRRGLDPGPIAVRDFNRYTKSTLPIKARCGKCGAVLRKRSRCQCTLWVQQATSHVWPKMKEAANLGRPRLIDASSLTVLNREFPCYYNNIAYERTQEQCKE